MKGNAAPPDRSTEYHVVAAVGQETQLAIMVSLAQALTAGGRGRVTLLSVTPDGSRPSWLQVREDNDPLLAIEVRRSSETGAEILEAVRDLDPDLLLLGWSGEDKPRGYLLGSTLDPVVRYAPCDVAVVRGDRLAAVRKVLVAAGGGANAELAIELALSMSPTTEVTVLYVASSSIGPVGAAAGRELLDQLLASWADEARVSSRVVAAGRVIDGILKEAQRGYDLMIIGASGENYVSRKLFGDVPQQVGTNAPVPALIVRRRLGPIKSIVRQAEWALGETSHLISMADRIATYRETRRGARPRLDFFVMLGCAAAIATMGLIMDSPSVTIGAMVIAPLQSALFGISLGVVQGDARLLWQAIGTTLKGAALAIAIGIILSIMIPVRTVTREMAIHSQPLLFDLVVALFAGLAGAYARVRRSLLSTLSGIAIAVALVPPMAAVGIGITRMDVRMMGGALLLFLTNLSAILAAGSLVFVLFGFRPDPGRRVRVFSRSMMGVLILFGIVASALTWLTVRYIIDVQDQSRIEAALHAELAQIEQIDLDTWKIFEQRKDLLQLDVQVYATQDLSSDQVEALQHGLAARLNRPVRVRLAVTRITYFDGVAPAPAAAIP